MIYRRKEGERYRFGLNWDISKYSLFQLALAFPISCYRSMEVDDFAGYSAGLFCNVLMLGFRIRPRHITSRIDNRKTVLWKFHKETWAVGHQRTVVTLEQLMDRKT